MSLSENTEKIFNNKLNASNYSRWEKGGLRCFPMWSHYSSAVRFDSSIVCLLIWNLNLVSLWAWTSTITELPEKVTPFFFPDDYQPGTMLDSGNQMGATGSRSIVVTVLLSTMSDTCTQPHGLWRRVITGQKREGLRLSKGSGNCLEMTTQTWV